MNGVEDELEPPGDLRGASLTYHLVPTEVWRRHQAHASYIPEAFDVEGFIHTTNDLGALLEVANLFYRSDDRPYLVLVLDLNAVKAEVRHDDPSGLYPHLYGPLNVDAVVGCLVARRAPDGHFLRFERPSGSQERLPGA